MSPGVRIVGLNGRAVNEKSVKDQFLRADSRSEVVAASSISQSYFLSCLTIVANRDDALLAFIAPSPA